MRKALLILAIAALLITAGVIIESYSYSVSAKAKDKEESKSKVERKVTNIKNGVIIEVTSSDPKAVKEIQETASEKKKSKKKRGPGKKYDKIKRTVKNIDNGVQIKVTSDDPKVVKEIQKRAKEGAFYDEKALHESKKGNCEGKEGHGGCGGKGSKK